jgi:DNA-binding LytR/AlgR family response regulator
MEEYGWDIIGPAPTLDAALKIIQQHAQTIDVAVLDINIQGYPVTPVAMQLQELNIPFVFLTGYGDADAMLPAQFEHHPTLLKPVRDVELLETVNKLIQASNGQ